MPCKNNIHTLGYKHVSKFQEQDTMITLKTAKHGASASATVSAMEMKPSLGFDIPDIVADRNVLFSRKAIRVQAV